MPSFIRNHISVQALDENDEPFNVPDFLIDEAEFQLFLWSIGASNTEKTFGNFTAFTRQPWVNMAWANTTESVPPEWPLSRQRKWISAARWKLFGDFRTLHLRLAAVECFLERREDVRFLRSIYSKHELGVNEVDLHNILLEDRSAVSAVIKALRMLEDRTARQDFTLSEITIRNQMWEDVKKYKLRQAAKAKAGAKLNFIATHNHLSVDDLAGELFIRGLGFYLLARPLKSRLHASNSAKSAMDGGVLQLIQFYTNPDRARITADRDGFQVTEISLDAWGHDAIATDLGQEDADGQETLEELEDRLFSP